MKIWKTDFLSFPGQDFSKNNLMFGFLVFILIIFFFCLFCLFVCLFCFLFCFVCLFVFVCFLFVCLSSQDPGIHNETGYLPFDSGLEPNVFVTDRDGELFVGKVRKLKVARLAKSMI